MNEIDPSSVISPQNLQALVQEVMPFGKYQNTLIADLPEEYLLWFDVLCALAHTSPSYKALGEYFSMKSAEKYDPVYFNKIWDSILLKKNNSLSISKKDIAENFKYNPTTFGYLEFGLLTEFYEKKELGLNSIIFLTVSLGISPVSGSPYKETLVTSSIKR